MASEKKELEEMKYHGVTIHKNRHCGTWYTRIRINGEQNYISAKTQAECLKKLKIKINEKKLSESEQSEKHSLQSWYNKWFELFKKDRVKETTIVDYNKTLKYIPDSLMGKDISKITSMEIIEILNNEPHTRMRQKIYELLNALFTKALDYEIINKNVMKIIEKPKHIREKGIALNLEEQSEFVKGCDNCKWGNLYLLILYQGLRIGEALALTPSDIDLNKKVININKAMNTLGKIDSTKNKQSNRIVPIFAPSSRVIEKLDFNKKYIFDFSYTTAQKRLKELLIRINLPEISLHDLRHTFITNCKNEGIPEHIIQHWVGHEIGSKVTSRVYTHITEDANLFNINKLNNSKFYSSSTQK